MIKRFLDKARGLHPDFLAFLLATACAMFAQGIMDSSFNNFLNDSFHLNGLQRTLMEVPRELPGFLVVFVSGILFFMGNRTLALFSQILTAAGALLIGLASNSYSIMLVWLFIYSSGQHLFIPLSSDIGMELAKEGQMGRRLGQLQAAGNFTAILGSFIIFLGFKFFRFNFKIGFIIASASFLTAALFLGTLKKNPPQPFKKRFILRKEYGMYYWLSILFGTRKQIFLTFAPWVLVTVFKQPVQTIATLLTIAGVIGIGFKPLLGRAIDKLGERKIFIFEAVFLFIICLFYGFAKKLFTPGAALIVTCACYIIDNLLFAVGMARATYMKKIAVKPEDVTPTLSMSTSIDHVFSISIALVGGVLWNGAGYQYIFIMGAGIALVNFITVVNLKVPGSAVKIKESITD
jgi:predicted MFS family arabinose efflux permease